jgi:Ser/Thr protein kinase RdoA (MazF antagonist)
VDDSYFSLVAYEKARGRLPDVEDWNATLFQNWGQVMGKIHYLTKQYHTHEQLKNIHWDAREVENFDRIIPNDQEKVVENSKKLLARIRKIPKDKDSYGFIHCDFHHKNFFVDISNISLIDFDDARNNWFIADIATSLFYAMKWSLNSLDNDVTPQKFLYNFLSGYIRENHIDSKMLKYIHDFLKYEQLKTYVHFYRYFEMNKPNISTLGSFYQTKENIETETPVFNIDIDLVYSLL